MGEKIKSYRILFGESIGNRSFGRLRILEDNIKMDLGQLVRIRCGC
jgi:hypothetical protein